MKKLIFLLFLAGFLGLIQAQDADAILEKVDQNMTSKNQVSESEMVVHGRRGSRTMVSKGWSEGDKRSMSEYLAPAREKGTKMLKLDDRLWIYSPSSDRIVQISGHMLRQSVMGSDLSYEDMMEDRKMQEMYNATISGSEIINERDCWILQLEGKVDDIAYQSRKVWVDKERFVPMQEELFAKSGQLLKKTVMKDIVKIDGRWYPKTVIYKDMLKDGKGTEFRLLDIKFDQDIPEHIFSKAILKK